MTSIERKVQENRYTIKQYFFPIHSILNLGPNVQSQILQTDRHTLRISGENLIKDQSISPLVIMFSILIFFPLDFALTLG